MSPYRFLINLIVRNGAPVLKSVMNAYKNVINKSKSITSNGYPMFNLSVEPQNPELTVNS